MTIVLDGQPSKIAVTTFQPIPSNSPSGNFVSTLTLASTLRLVADQYLSIFIEVQCQSVAPWKVLANSSFSVVLVSRWESDYNAGFLTNSIISEFNNAGYNIINYWDVPLFSKNFNVTWFDGINIKNSGLYFLQSVVILDDRLGNKTFDSVVCTANKIALSGITASKVSEGLTGEFAISAFGVLYLRKGQNVNLCVRSKTNTNYQRRNGSWFSMVRFLPLGQPPGFHQILQDTRNISVYCEWSVIRSMSTGGGQLAYIKNNIFNPNPTLPCDKEDFTAPLSGTYLISVMFTLKGNASDNVTTCVGIRKCGECYIEVTNTVRQYSNTFGFVGLVDLEKGQLISTCLKSKDQAFSIKTGTRSVQFLSVVELNRTVQLKHRSVGLSSSGWHELVEWETRSGKSLQKSVPVKENGLYILSTNLHLEVDEESLVGVKLEATGSSNRDVLSILSNSEADSTVTYSVAVVARLNASEEIAVSVYSNSQYASTSNTTFFAALVTQENQHPCLSLRSKTSRYDSGEWWKGIEHWESVDAQCVSPNSDVSKGIFVADVAGVYFLAAVVVVRTSHLSHQTRLVELLLSVNGDTINTNGLKATKGVTDGLSVVLSLSATAYLEPWQTLYLMIRSTGVGAFEVVNGSTFSVALIEETKYYKTVATNITHFDNGPRVTRHPPPSVSLGDDLGLNVSWTCDAVAKGNVAYNWLKNDQIITSSRDLSLENVKLSDSGQYVCLAEYDSIKVFSQAAELHVFDTTPQFENKVFTAQENSNASFELTFSALDEQRRPANVSLDIIKGNTNDTFVLSCGVSKDKFTMRNRMPLDHETKNLYRLTLAATNQDTRKTTTVNVTVIISDVNDNPPIFTS
ncbi:Cadherin cytoplasmic C-terminal, partial [Desmophyllum pertusum]